MELLNKEETLYCYIAPQEESEIIGIHQLKENNTYNLLIATNIRESFFLFNSNSQNLVQVERKI